MYRARNLKTGVVEEIWPGDYRYKGLDEVIPFTGRLLLGDDFIEDMYIHMGYHPAPSYREVVELRFEQGKLVDARNPSEEMAEHRKAMKHRLLTSPSASVSDDKLKEWINDRMSLDFDW